MRLIMIAATAALLLLIGTARASSNSSIRVGVDILPDKDSSYILIGDLPSEVQIGDNMSIPLSIYRGVTLKRTVYAWIEDSSGRRVSTKAKLSLPERFRAYNLSAYLEVTSCPGSAATLIVSGLGINSTRDMVLDITECQEENKEVQGKITYEIIDRRETVFSGKEFKTRIMIHNPTENDLEVDAWSYVYRSSRCYSGEREQNRKTHNLPEFSNITFDLENIVDASPGEYSLKVKLLRSDRKTPDEFTFPIEVKDAQDNSSGTEVIADKLSSKGDSDESDAPERVSVDAVAEKRTLFDSSLGNASSGTIYESSSAKARRFTVYFLIVALTLILVALIIKKL